VVAMVELDEGPMIMSNIANCEVDTVKIGMRVSVTFERASEDIAIPLFVPNGGAE
jgi:uncharacterized OB-fold protein